MSRARDVRRCALQALYQLDCGNADAALIGSLGPEGDERADERVLTDAKALGERVWNARHDADKEISRFTPEWPIHRQPVVDRNVLRLAWWEMTRGGTPAPVAINEAVELAKEFGSEKSGAFVNGVLDRVRRERDGAEGASSG